MKKLKQELKEIIVKECEKDIDPSSIKDDELLFGSKSSVGLDSLDALQISMAIKNRYDILITDSKQLRKVMANINSLAEYINEK